MYSHISLIIRDDYLYTKLFNYIFSNTIIIFDCCQIFIKNIEFIL